MKFKIMIRFTSSFFFICYRFIKSGLLLDFFVKRFVIILSYYFFYIFNISFNEKYFIENIFFKFTPWNRFFKSFFNVFSNNFSYVAFSFAILFILVFFILLFCIKYVMQYYRHNIPNRINLQLCKHYYFKFFFYRHKYIYGYKFI